MALKFLCFIISILIIYEANAAKIPISLNAVKDDASNEETPWIWPSGNREGRGFKLRGDQAESDEYEHDEHCHHHHHHHINHHLHFGPPRHRHFPYDGAMEYYRHQPTVYPPHLAPFGQSFSTAERAPAPVFEDQEEGDDTFSNGSNVPLSPYSSTTTTQKSTTSTTAKATMITTTTTLKPAFENIDLRFGS